MSFHTSTSPNVGQHMSCAFSEGPHIRLHALTAALVALKHRGMSFKLEQNNSLRTEERSDKRRLLETKEYTGYVQHLQNEGAVEYNSNTRRVNTVCYRATYQHMLIRSYNLTL